MSADIDWPVLRAARALGQAPASKLAQLHECTEREATRLLARSLGAGLLGNGGNGLAPGARLIACPWPARRTCVPCCCANLRLCKARLPW